MSSSPLCACREGELSAKTHIHQLTGGFKAVELGEFSREREARERAWPLQPPLTLGGHLKVEKPAKESGEGGGN